MLPDASAPQLQTRTVELPALAVRAAVALKTIDAEARTVDLTFSTGAAVRRFDWWTGQAYLEKLSLDPQAVRLGRLNSGAPLLDTHSGYRLANQLGVVEDDSASVDGKRGMARVRFSKRSDVEPVFQDVQDRIYRNVSVGYIVHEYEETPAKRKGGLPTRTAIDWEPYEISMVPMPADAGAQTRSGKAGEGDAATRPDLPLYPCLITVRAADASPQEGRMNPEMSESIAERDPLDPGAPIATRTPEAVAEPQKTDAQLGAEQERLRVQGIMAACRASRMTTEFQDKLIAENVSLVDAQTRVFDEMRKRGADSAGPQATAVRDVKLGEDPLVHVRAGITDALLHRMAPQHFQLTDVGRKYRGMTMLDIARVYLQGRGIRVTDMPRHDLAGAALGLVQVRSGWNTTSDFPELLADVANKTLRAEYEAQPQTFRPLVRVVSLVDFKPVRRVQMGDAPALLPVNEAGEFKYGTISDGSVSYQLASYGRIFAVTRQALINDDLDAFSRVPAMFGRKARVLESNLVWEQITGNPTMGDGFALFSSDHANLAADGDHISVESLGRARSALRQQRSVDGDYLNLNAVYLLVPTGLETKADQFVSVVVPQLAGNVNPFQSKLQVIAEPRLDANSATAWYLAASPANVDIIELGYLDGAEGPRIESQVGFDVDGLKIKAALDVVAKAIDYRGLHKDPGDLDS